MIDRSPTPPDDHDRAAHRIAGEAHAAAARLDRDFARFVATGDSARLAAVFDATATNLLRVATHLVGDPHDAEDLVQETFLTAIAARSTFVAAEHPSVAAWLLGILHNRARRLWRDGKRRVDPERAMLSLQRLTEADPSVVAEGGELDAAVSDVIAALPEVYRPVLRLALRNGMTAADIAINLERPPGTVRTQIVRGLELLRQRLPQSIARALPIAIGIGAGLGAPARGLAAVRARVLDAALTTEAATLGAATTISLSIMTTKKLLTGVVCAVALVLAVLGVSRALDSRPKIHGDSPIVPVVTPFETSDEVRPTPVEASTADQSIERVTIDATTPSEPANSPRAFGSVFARVLWNDTSEPAPDVVVRVFHWGTPSPLLRITEAITGPDGTARIDGVPTGAIEIRTDDEQVEATLEAGGLASVTLHVQRWATVNGIVVDELGVPVAGATVMRSGYFNHSSGWPVATTDARGRFSIPVGESRYLGARKAGYRAALYRHFELGQGDSTEVELVLRNGAARLTGKVHDPRGAPIRGAVVESRRRSGRIYEQDDGRQLHEPPGPRTVTDELGEFVLEGLEPGDHPFAARSSEHGAWSGSVRLSADQATTITIVLADAAAVRGTVLDHRGEPVAKASISIGQEYGTLLDSRCKTGADGSYRLEGLTPGPLTLRASHDGAGVATTTVHLLAGSVTTWDPRLDPGLQIRGRVLDDDGAPRAGMIVQAEVQERFAQEWKTGRTDERGAFAFAGLRDATYRVLVRSDFGSFDSARIDDVRPRTAETLEELSIVVEAAALATARVRGRFVAPQGQRPPPGQRVMLWRDGMGMWPNFRSDPSTGVFELGPFPPGLYRAQATVEDGPSFELGELTLRADQTHDLGDVRVGEFGSVEVRAPLLPPEFSVAICSSSGAHIVNLLARGGVARCDDLAPGEYQARVHGFGFAPFSIVAKGTREVFVDRDERQADRVISIRDSAAAERTGEGRALSMSVDVLDARGHLVDRIQVKPSERQDWGWRIRTRAPSNEACTVVVAIEYREIARREVPIGGAIEIDLDANASGTR